MLTHKEAARIQLDRAIRLFLDERDYVSCITLAGAAEGMLGEKLTKSGFDHAVVSQAKGYGQLLSEEEREALRDDKKSFERTMIDDWNLVKNWLKHHRSEAEHLEINRTKDCMFVAYDMIERAATNYMQLFGDITDQMQRFYDYQSQEHS